MFKKIKTEYKLREWGATCTDLIESTRCGEVAVLETRSGPGRGKRCALLCETLARSFRRGGGASVVDRPGRR